MKYREIKGGLLVYVTNEEQVLIDLITDHNGIIKKKDLHPRLQEVAKDLTIKNVLIRRKINDELYYMIDTLEDIWRN